MSAVMKKKLDREVMKELRVFREHSLREVAAKMGVSHAWVQQVENGNAPLTRASIVAFLNALNLSEEDWDLVKGEIQSMDEIRLECLGRIHNLSPEKISRVLLLIRSLQIVVIVSGASYLSF